MRLASTALATVLLCTSSACGARVASDGGESAESDTSGAGPTSSSSSTSASSSTTDGDGDADDDATDDGDDFVPNPDYGSTDPCSVFDQDCPEGEKCVTTLDPDFNVFRCIPVLGDKAVGEACIFDSESGTDDCDANSHCWQLEADEQGIEHGECVPMCSGTPDNPSCPGQGESCEGFECRILGQVGYPFCIERCDPIAQDCGDGKSCYYDGGYLAFFCGVVNVPGALGEPCEWTQECAAGLICVSAQALPECPGASCCAPFCVTGDDASCEASWLGTVCSDALTYPLMEGCPTYGACVIPSP